MSYQSYMDLYAFATLSLAERVDFLHLLFIKAVLKVGFKLEKWEREGWRRGYSVEICSFVFLQHFESRKRNCMMMTVVPVSVHTVMGSE